MTDDSSDQGGKVGYKPSAHSLALPERPVGQSRGRLKGVRNFAADIKRSLEIPVTLNDKGRGKRVSTQEALVLRLREKALKGDNRALETLLGLAGPTQQSRDPKASSRDDHQFESPPLHQEVRASGGGFPGFKILRHFRPLASPESVCRRNLANMPGLCDGMRLLAMAGLINRQKE